MQKEQARWLWQYARGQLRLEMQCEGISLGARAGAGLAVGCKIGWSGKLMAASVGTTKEQPKLIVSMDAW